jgi:hypothetical protein
MKLISRLFVDVVILLEPTMTRPACILLNVSFEQPQLIACLSYLARHVK